MQVEGPVSEADLDGLLALSVLRGKLVEEVVSWQKRRLVASVVRPRPRHLLAQHSVPLWPKTQRGLVEGKKRVAHGHHMGGQDMLGDVC